MSTYEEGVKKGEIWPGYTDARKNFTSNEYIEVPKNPVNFMGTTELARTFGEIVPGWNIINGPSYVDRRDFPPHLRYIDQSGVGRESAGIIVEKTVKHNTQNFLCQ